MRLERLEHLSDLPAAEWNTLVPDHHPFLSHAFLSALERHGCVSEAVGWQPWHVVCRDDHGQVLGAAPLYLKTHSYGEFVFDWGWAEAYRRQGLSYYPKLVSAIPYTPVTSPRLLLMPNQSHPQQTAQAIVNFTLGECRRHRLPSSHWLFPGRDETKPIDV